MKLKKLTLTSILASMALIIFTIESRLPPIWVPGIKPGLSNVIILIAILFGGYTVGAGVLFTKIILGSIFCGTAMSFIFSLVGGICAYGVMCITMRFIGKKQLWVVSVFGAMAHNVGQLCVAVAAVENINAFILLPIMLVASIITGTFTGLCVQFLWSSPLHKFKL